MSVQSVTMMEDAIDYADSLMADGKASELAGWTMKDILAQVKKRFGQEGSDHVRKYIIYEACDLDKEFFNGG